MSNAELIEQLQYTRNLLEDVSPDALGLTNYGHSVVIKSLDATLSKAKSEANTNDALKALKDRGIISSD